MTSINFDFYKNIIHVKKWTPLKLIVNKIKDDKFLTRFYYEISNGVYFQASPFKGNDYQNSMDSPYVTAVLFCGSKKPAERIIQFDIENDDDSFLEMKDFFNDSGIGNGYTDILNFLKRENASFINESASYRVAQDGAFLFKAIETEKYKFYFRSIIDMDDEKPFGFLYKFND